MVTVLQGKSRCFLAQRISRLFEANGRNIAISLIIDPRQSEGVCCELSRVTQWVPQRFHNQTDQRIREGIRR